VRRPSKPRDYDASSRKKQSAATRQRIIDAARELLVTHGYRAATVAAIAREAGVHVDTVYELVGRKPQLLRELIEQALSGVDRAVPGERRDHVQAMVATSDAVEKLRIYASAMRETHARLAPLFLAVRDASNTEPEARETWHEISERRATNMHKLIADLRTTGRLRPELSSDMAADVMWATNSPELYVMLTKERGWTPEHYETWILDSWCRLLLTAA
jgi:AcrR family transcriptional regulator